MLRVLGSRIFRLFGTRRLRGTEDRMPQNSLRFQLKNANPVFETTYLGFLLESPQAARLSEVAHDLVSSGATESL